MGKEQKENSWTYLRIDWAMELVNTWSSLVLIMPSCHYKQECNKMVWYYSYLFQTNWKNLVVQSHEPSDIEKLQKNLWRISKIPFSSNLSIAWYNFGIESKPMFLLFIRTHTCIEWFNLKHGAFSWSISKLELANYFVQFHRDTFIQR